MSFRRKERSFLEPLVHMPFRPVLFGDALFSGIEFIQCEVHSFADVALGFQADVGAVFPGLFYYGLCVFHVILRFRKPLHSPQAPEKAM
jgi:hypothetical protein